MLQDYKKEFLSSRTIGNRHIRRQMFTETVKSLSGIDRRVAWFFIK